MQEAVTRNGSCENTNMFLITGTVIHDVIDKNCDEGS